MCLDPGDAGGSAATGKAVARSAPKVGTRKQGQIPRHRLGNRTVRVSASFQIFFRKNAALIKKESEIFLKEIHVGSVAKSYIRKGFLIYEEVRKYLAIYEEAISHI